MIAITGVAMVIRRLLALPSAAEVAPGGRPMMSWCVHANGTAGTLLPPPVVQHRYDLVVKKPSIEFILPRCVARPYKRCVIRLILVLRRLHSDVMLNRGRLRCNCIGKQSQ
jgi:hypothetical protein